MTQTSVELTFEEYLNYDDGTDNRYELDKGKLIEMPLGRGKHADIIDALNDTFKLEIKRLGLDWVCRHSSIGVKIPLVGRRATSRIPDVCVLTTAHWRELQNQSAVLVDFAPLLVVEVVSAGTKVIDHRGKRAEYNAAGIPEYWIVDFIQDAPKYPPGVTVLNLIAGLYEASVFRGDERIVSQIFPQLVLTANQVLGA